MKVDDFGFREAQLKEDDKSVLAASPGYRASSEYTVNTDAASSAVYQLLVSFWFLPTNQPANDLVMPTIYISKPGDPWQMIANTNWKMTSCVKRLRSRLPWNSRLNWNCFHISIKINCRLRFCICSIWQSHTMKSLRSCSLKWWREILTCRWCGACSILWLR